MKRPLILAIVVTGTLAACQLTPEPTITVVEGTVLSKYTRQPLTQVPVTVRSWRYTLFSGVGADSITSILTDANGHYQLSFDATAKGTIYRADIKDSRLVYDLTDYSKYEYRSASDGAPLVNGQGNKVNFEATPYVPVKIFLDADKKGASLLDVFFSADDSDKQGYFSGTAFTDTTRTTQHVTTTVTAKVIPNRTYFFILSRALVNCKRQYECNTTQSSSVVITRYIANTDTSTIRFH